MLRTDLSKPLLDPHGGTVSPGKEKSPIESAAEARLRESCYHEVRRVKCLFHEGVLTLRGCVSSYYLKQIAQSLVCPMEGVDHVNNHVQVV